jgi:threonine dehydratase
VLPPPHLRDDIPAHLQLKLENLQVSGSFKARGLFNHLLQLSPEQRARGVVAASGGNHALAVAYGAWRLGIDAKVCIPATASPDRTARIAAFGVQVIHEGTVFDDAQRRALALASDEGRYLIHPFDAERTLEGTGTLGLELLDDLPDLDCVLIACGGGGLLAGMAAAIKQRNPGVRVVGVEPTGAPTMLRAIEAGQVVTIVPQTFADTLSPRAVSELTRRLTAEFVDEIVLVSDAAMVDAMRWLWTSTNQLVEPSGAAVIAAIQTGAVDIARHRCPVALICGGNAAANTVFNAYAQAAR